MRKICALFFLVVAAVSLTCCANKDSASASTTGNSATPAAGGTTALASNNSVGVPECDSYIQKYMECIGSKVPEASRAQYQAAFDQMTKAWQQAASTPQGKAALAMGCKTAQTSAEQAMKPYGCSF